FFFFSSRRRHTRFSRDWSSDVCSSDLPVEGPRYGVAGEAELYVGKVLSDEGAGADGTVLQGIDWAIENGCHVLSLSLGSAMQPRSEERRVGKECRYGWSA